MEWNLAQMPRKDFEQEKITQMVQECKKECSSIIITIHQMNKKKCHTIHIHYTYNEKGMTTNKIIKGTLVLIMKNNVECWTNIV